MDNAQSQFLGEVYAQLEVGVLDEVKEFSMKVKNFPMLMDVGANSALDEQQWDEAQTMLVQATKAFDKLIKEAQKLHQQLGSNKSDSLWTLLFFT